MKKKLGIKSSVFYVVWRSLCFLIGFVFVISMVMSTSKFGSVNSLSKEEKTELLQSTNFRIAVEAARWFVTNPEQSGDLKDIRGIRCNYNKPKNNSYSNNAGQTYVYADLYIDLKGKEDLYLTYRNGVFEEKTTKVNPDFSLVDSQNDKDVVYLGETLAFVKQAAGATDLNKFLEGVGEE